MRGLWLLTFQVICTVVHIARNLLDSEVSGLWQTAEYHFVEQFIQYCDQQTSGLQVLPLASLPADLRVSQHQHSSTATARYSHATNHKQTLAGDPRKHSRLNMGRTTELKLLVSRHVQAVYKRVPTNGIAQNEVKDEIKLER
jgi:hypothetical protein